MRTLTSEIRRKPLRPASFRYIRGFTLVELLVVFAIAALLMGVVPIAFERMREAAQYRSTLRTSVADLRHARHKAVAEGVEVNFRIDIGRRTFGLEGSPFLPVPTALQVKATVAATESYASDQVGIRFLPSGGASGGSIEVIRASGSGTRLRVDWLSGQVSQEPLL